MAKTGDSKGVVKPNAQSSVSAEPAAQSSPQPGPAQSTAKTTSGATTNTANGSQVGKLSRASSRASIVSRSESRSGSPGLKLPGSDSDETPKALAPATPIDQGKTKSSPDASSKSSDRATPEEKPSASPTKLPSASVSSSALKSSSTGGKKNENQAAASGQSGSEKAKKLPGTVSPKSSGTEPKAGTAAAASKSKESASSKSPPKTVNSAASKTEPDKPDKKLNSKKEANQQSQSTGKPKKLAANAFLANDKQKVKNGGDSSVKEAGQVAPGAAVPAKQATSGSQQQKASPKPNLVASSVTQKKDEAKSVSESMKQAKVQDPSLKGSSTASVKSVEPGTAQAKRPSDDPGKSGSGTPTPPPSDAQAATSKPSTPTLAVPPEPKGAKPTSPKSSAVSVGKPTVPPSPGKQPPKAPVPLPAPSFAAAQPAVQMVSPPSTSGALPAPQGLTNSAANPEPQEAHSLAVKHLNDAVDVLRSVEAAKQKVQARIRAIARDRLAMAQSEAAHNSLALQEMMDAKTTMEAALQRAEKSRKEAEAEAKRRRRELELAAEAARAAHDEAIMLHDEENEKTLAEIVSKHKAAQAQLAEIEKAIEEQEAAAYKHATGVESRGALPQSTPPKAGSADSKTLSATRSPPSSPLRKSESAMSTEADMYSRKSHSDDISRHALRIAAIQEALDVLQRSADFEADSAVFLALRAELKNHREALQRIRSAGPVSGSAAGSTMGSSPPHLPQMPTTAASTSTVDVAGSAAPDAPLVAPIPVNHADELMSRLMAYEEQMKSQAQQLADMRQELNESPSRSVAPPEMKLAGVKPPTEALGREKQTTVKTSTTEGSTTSSATSRSESPVTQSSQRRGSMFNNPLGYYVPAIEGTGPRLNVDVEPSSVLQSLGIQRKLSVKLSDRSLRQLQSVVEDNAPKFMSPQELRQMEVRTRHLSSAFSEQLRGKGRTQNTKSPETSVHSLMTTPSVQMASLLPPQDCASTIAMVMQGTVHRRVHVLLKQIERQMTSTEKHILKLLRQTANHFSTTHRSNKMARGSLAMARQLADNGQWEESQRLLQSVRSLRINEQDTLDTIKQIKTSIDEHYLEMVHQRSSAEDDVLHAEAELHALLSAVAHAFFSQAQRANLRSQSAHEAIKETERKIHKAAKRDPAFRSVPPGMQLLSMHQAAESKERDQLEAEILALSSM